MRGILGQTTSRIMVPGAGKMSRGMYGMKLNRSHPIAANLVCAMLPMGNGVYDFVSTAFSNTLTGGLNGFVSLKKSGPSIALGQSATFTPSILGAGRINWSSGPFSALVLVNCLSSTAFDTFFALFTNNSSSDNKGWGIGTAQSDSTKFGVRIHKDNSTFDRPLNASPSPNVANDALIGFTADGSSRLQTYADGVANALYTTGNLVPTAVVTGDCYFGILRSAGVGWTAYVAYAWNRELSAAEMRAFASDPFLLFEPDTQSRIPYTFSPDDFPRYYSWQTR